MKESDLDAALTALANRRAAAEAAETGPSRTHVNRRAALGLALIALLVGGVLQVSGPASMVRDASTDSRAAKVFGNAQRGTCLSWPPDQPDKPSFVQCSSDHLFEVASSVGMGGFGESCQRTVSQYLGAQYDPDSRFTSGVVWAGDATSAPADRTLLCGLQLLGVGGRPLPFRGSVADLDQSRVWPSGTCLGVDTWTNRSAQDVVDCAEPHAAEVAGAISLAERFTAGPPSEADQDAFVRDECVRLANGYLAPRGLQGSGLVSEFTVLSQASWNAGSRQVSCTVTPPAGRDRKPLVGRVGREQSDIAPPAAPIESVAPAPVPVATPPAISSSSPTSSPPTTTSAPPVPAPTTSTTATTSPTATAPTTSTTPTASTTPNPAESPVPPPGPPPGEVVASSEAPPPNVIFIPGLAPITLPAMP